MRARLASRRGIGPYAVVPVKGFVGAKERLATVLSTEERARLAEAMLRDVLHTLIATEEIAGILVVTSDPQAAELARQFGAEVVDDVRRSGTNAAVLQGLHTLVSQGLQAALIVPGDIPLMTANELREVIACARTCRAVIVPAAHDGGTNLLFMSPAELFHPCFGTGSFAKHVMAARAAGIELCVLRPEGIGLDVDGPDDLARLMSHQSDTRARKVLFDMQNATRIPQATNEFRPLLSSPNQWTSQ